MSNTYLIYPPPFLYSGEKKNKIFPFLRIMIKNLPVQNIKGTKTLYFAPKTALKVEIKAFIPFNFTLNKAL